MTAPEKPGLSNEERMKEIKYSLECGYTLTLETEKWLVDRLEALIGQGKPTPGQIGGEEALLTSKPEPVAPARKWEAEDGK